MSVGALALTLVAVGTAQAAPAGFKVTKTTDACTISSGPADAAGIVPMMAECVWPDVTLDKVDARFSPWDAHDEVFSAIVSSVIERTDGGKAYVRQVHRAKGITDRECVLEMTKTSEGGGTKFAWRTSPPGAISADRVEVEHDVGYWLFVPRAEGGVAVTYYLEYGPGGSVPGFIVRAFQGSGFEGATTELRAFLTR